MGVQFGATLGEPVEVGAPLSNHASGIDFPRCGSGIGGFRLVSELGRGAFGRVYMAEEAGLGNRPVALKITLAEGDEPRILARLQHTHIVPIYSVRDDPETGLRLLCMPFFGGANLAQVLDAASVSSPGTRAGLEPDRGARYRRRAGSQRLAPSGLDRREGGPPGPGPTPRVRPAHRC